MPPQENHPLNYAAVPPWDRVSVRELDCGREWTIKPAPFLKECIPLVVIILIPSLALLAALLFSFLGTRQRFMNDFGIDLLRVVDPRQFAFAVLAWFAAFVLPLVVLMFFRGERWLRLDAEIFSVSQPGVFARFLKPQQFPLREVDHFELAFFGLIIRAIGPSNGKIGGFGSRRLHAKLVGDLNRCLNDITEDRRG